MSNSSGVTITCPEPLTFFFEPDYIRYRVAYGGRSSGKSWTAAQGLVVRAMREKIRILCCREIQKSIKESVKKTIESNIERLGFADFFTFKQDSIVAYNGSEFIFQGLHANVQQIKSLENISIAYVEEAETVSEESWQVLIPTIRAAQSEIWVCFNPKDMKAYTETLPIELEEQAKEEAIGKYMEMFSHRERYGHSAFRTKLIHDDGEYYPVRRVRLDDLGMGRDRFRLPMVDVDEYSFRGRSRDSMGRFK